MPRVLLSVITFLSDNAVGSCMCGGAPGGPGKHPSLMTLGRYQTIFVLTSIKSVGAVPLRSECTAGAVGMDHSTTPTGVCGGAGALGDQLRRTGRPERADSVAASARRRAAMAFPMPVGGAVPASTALDVA